MVLLSGSSQALDGGTSCLLVEWVPSLPSIRASPSVNKATQFSSFPDPPGMSAATQRRSLDVIEQLNRTELADVNDPGELVREFPPSQKWRYKMQTSVPDLQDLSKEPESIHKMYGTTPCQPSLPANNCLLARRGFVERESASSSSSIAIGDTHGANLNDDIVNKLPAVCRETDGPAAALVKDLTQRGPLDDTLINWAGEFG